MQTFLKVLEWHLKINLKKSNEDGTLLCVILLNSSGCFQLMMISHSILFLTELICLFFKVESLNSGGKSALSSVRGPRSWPDCAIWGNSNFSIAASLWHAQIWFISFSAWWSQSWPRNFSIDSLIGLFIIPIMWQFPNLFDPRAWCSYKNPVLYHLRWSRRGDASAGNRLQIQMKLR